MPSVIAIIWSVIGGIVLIVTTIGAMVKWNCHDHWDLELAKARNKARSLEIEREKRLLT